MKFYQTILDFFFPPHCITCGREGSLLCSSCAKDILPHKIGECKPPKNLQDLFFYASYKSNSKLQKVIKAGKYRHMRDANKIFGRHLADILLKKTLKNVILVPVPLHWKRQWQRGFNQSDILAQEISIHTGYPVQNILKRTKNTPPQASQSSRQDRLDNISDAFTLSSKTSLNPDAHYILVDDISTTGGTLSACAQPLVSAGMQHISAIVIAHE